MKPKIIVILLLIVLLVVILMQNTEIVEFQVLIWKFAMSRIILISFVLVIGIVIGYLLAKLERRQEGRTKKTME